MLLSFISFIILHSIVFNNYYFINCGDIQSLSGKPDNYPYFYQWNHHNQTFIKKTHKAIAPDAPSLQKDFYTAKPSMPFRSHSQRRIQDMLVLDIFNNKSHGYFVDLAANDWSHLSNSFVIEYYKHWEGVCIEPNPEYLLGLLSNRKCHIFTNPVSSANNDIIKFNINGVFGGIIGNDYDNKVGKNTVDMYTVTLTSILDLVHAPNVCILYLCLIYTQ